MSKPYPPQFDANRGAPDGVLLAGFGLLLGMILLLLGLGLAGVRHVCRVKE